MRKMTPLRENRKTLEHTMTYLGLIYNNMRAMFEIIKNLSF